MKHYKSLVLKGTQRKIERIAILSHFKAITLGFDSRTDCSIINIIAQPEKMLSYDNIFFLQIINIQPDGSKAKPYQVKQIRNLILKYGLEV